MAIRAPSILTPEVRRFLTGTPPRYATIATTNADGSPHQIVVWFLLRGDEFIVNSRRGRRWPSNLGRDRRANLCVYEAEDAVAMEMTLERIYDGEMAQADIAEMAVRYDPPEVAKSAIARFQTEPRVTFVLRPTKAFIHGEPH
ncbi:MAG: pyridoxamine 5'-phosphate oxidase family protein [Chloroflexota bacterium]